MISDRTIEEEETISEGDGMENQRELSIQRNITQIINPTEEDRMVSIREKITQKDTINRESQSRTQTSEGLCWWSSGDQSTKR